MNKAIMILFAAFNAFALPKPIEPKIKKFEGNFHLDIGKSVQDALKKHDPYFETWRETDFIFSARKDYKPNAKQTMTGVVGDFNSDKRMDVAVIGRNLTNNLLLVALSEGDGYRVIEVDRSPVTDPRKEWIGGPKGQEPGLWRFLSHIRPGRITSPYEKEPLQLRSDAFEESYFEKGSVIYYFKNGQFHRFTAAD